LSPDPQHEIAAEREPDEPQRLAERRLQRAHRADHFRQQAGMEELPVEVVGIAVIAQVEAQDIEAALEELLAQRQHVQRLRTALPTVQQHHGAPAAERWSRAKALQAYAPATLEEHLPRCGEQRRGAARDRRTPSGRAGQHGLQMAVAKPQRRPEIIRRRSRACRACQARAAQRTRISTRLLALPARFHSPAVSSSVTVG
jgi:hypothetical protein